MRGKNHIDKRQLTVLVTITLMGSYFLVAPRPMVTHAGTAGWLGILGGALLGSIVAVLVILVHHRFPSKDFMGIAETVFGRFLGKIFTLSFFAYTMFIFIIIREFSTTLLTPFLPESPIGPVIIITGIILAYLVYSGIESIARVTQVFLPAIAFSLLFLLITAFSGGDIGRIQPWLGKGLTNLAQASLNSGAVFGEIIIFLVILSHLRRKMDDTSGVTWGIILAVIPLALITIAATVRYGAMGVPRLTFPAINIARVIRIGMYFERLEVIFVIIWFILSVLKIGIVLYAAAIALAGVFEMDDYRPLVLPTVVLSILLALLPETDYSVLLALDYFTSYTYPFTLLLPGLLLLVAILRNKKDPALSKKEEGGQND